ncbi:MAG TPA: hypothetical protein VEC37_06310, partial [Bacillota bacterium]|nr:hypothetical protein [Bacillota bacterium]
MSLPKVPLASSGLPIDREKAVKTFPWLSFLSLSFPGSQIEIPRVVKLAKDRLKRYLDEDEISYFYIFEQTPENGKPHIHLISDKVTNRADVHRLWQRCLPDYESADVHWGLSDYRTI